MKIWGGAANGAILFGVGVLGGVMLVAMLPGMPWITSVPDPSGNLDLGAQRSMAAAAWWMVAITALSSVVGAVGIYLIARTLQEAKRSADAADLAVKASQEAIVTAREMGQAQVRAYLMVSKVLLQEHPGEYHVTVFVKNSGQTPASKVWITAKIFFSVGSNDEAQFVEEDSGAISDLADSDDENLDLAMGAGLTTRLRELKGSQTATIHVDIEILYDDVFGDGNEITAAYYGFGVRSGGHIPLTRDLV